MKTAAALTQPLLVHTHAGLAAQPCVAVEAAQQSACVALSAGEGHGGMTMRACPADNRNMWRYTGCVCVCDSSVSNVCGHRIEHLSDQLCVMRSAVRARTDRTARPRRTEPGRAREGLEYEYIHE